MAEITGKYEIAVAFGRPLTKHDDRDRLRNQFRGISISSWWDVEHVDLRTNGAIITITATDHEGKYGNVVDEAKTGVARAIHKYGQYIQKQYEGENAPTEVVDTGRFSPPPNAQYRKSRQRQKSGELDRGEWIVEKEDSQNPGGLGETGFYIRTLDAGPTGDDKLPDEGLLATILGGD